MRTVVAALLLAAPAHAAVLVDYGTVPGSTGLTIAGTADQFGGFAAFQPFTVTDPQGWIIDTVTLFGGRDSDPANQGASLAFYAELAPSTPDFANPIGTRTAFFQNSQSLSTIPFINVTLPQGRYYFGFAPNSPGYLGAWYASQMSDPANRAVTRRLTAGTYIVQNQTMTMRIDGVVAPAPGASLALLAGTLAYARRRRV
ncbi:MAG: hypothetical protein SFY69_07050 [Planctomycetota bacterium]|nr:hypothetical protein [Planctomycetota bacterium]